MERSKLRASRLKELLERTGRKEGGKKRKRTILRFQPSDSVPEFRNDCQKQRPWNQLTITRDLPLRLPVGTSFQLCVTPLEKDKKGERIASEGIGGPGGARRAGEGDSKGAAGESAGGEGCTAPAQPEDPI